MLLLRWKGLKLREKWTRNGGSSRVVAHTSATDCSRVYPQHICVWLQIAAFTCFGCRFSTSPPEASRFQTVQGGKELSEKNSQENQLRQRFGPKNSDRFRASQHQVVLHHSDGRGAKVVTAHRATGRRCHGSSWVHWWFGRLYYAKVYVHRYMLKHSELGTAGRVFATHRDGDRVQRDSMSKGPPDLL